MDRIRLLGSETQAGRRGDRPAGAPDPVLLASQLQLIYDGGGLAANMDRDPAIAAPARAAAGGLIAAAISPRSK